MDTIMQSLEVVGLVLFREGRVDDSGVEGNNFFQPLKFG